ncbi:MAG: hypothetical protein HY866_23005 [Chloroflexi bacterium]|nr:hypothetical protein [Chloroflexota bacterium]
MCYPLQKHILGDMLKLRRFDHQGFQIHPLRQQFGFFTFALVITVLKVRRIPHLFNRIHQVTQRLAHLIQLGLNRRDPGAGIFALFVELCGDTIGNWL